MAEPTAAEMLTAVRTELYARVNGGLILRYTAFQQSLEREPSSILMEMEDRLVTRIATETTGGGMITNHAGFERPI